MDLRTGIFYIALLVILGCLAELYVRMKGIGERNEKIRGVVVPEKPRLGPPLGLLVIAIIAAAMTAPH